MFEGPTKKCCGLKHSVLGGAILTILCKSASVFVASLKPRAVNKKTSRGRELGGPAHMEGGMEIEARYQPGRKGVEMHRPISAQR